MIIKESRNPIYFILFVMVWIFNPFPKKLKIIRQNKYVLDIKARKKSKIFEQRELTRRKFNNEEAKKCYKISLKGSVDMYGNTG